MPEPLEDPRAILDRLLLLTAERAGSRTALCRHLGLTHAQLQRYLTRKAMPPAKVILRAVDLLIGHEDLKSISERTWRSLFLPYT